MLFIIKYYEKINRQCPCVALVVRINPLSFHCRQKKKSLHSSLMWYTSRGMPSVPSLCNFNLGKCFFKIHNIQRDLKDHRFTHDSF